MTTESRSGLPQREPGAQIGDRDPRSVQPQVIQVSGHPQYPPTVITEHQRQIFDSIVMPPTPPDFHANLTSRMVKHMEALGKAKREQEIISQRLLPGSIPITRKNIDVFSAIGETEAKIKLLKFLHADALRATKEVNQSAAGGTTSTNVEQPKKPTLLRRFLDKRRSKK